jgi:rhamnosyltransferase
VICAIYVAYHLDCQFPERVALIVPQVDHIIIVDNNSDAEEVIILRTLCKRVNVELIENKESLGIATVLNQGVRRAIERCASVILFLNVGTLEA